MAWRLTGTTKVAFFEFIDSIPFTFRTLIQIMGTNMVKQQTATGHMQLACFLFLSITQRKIRKLLSYAMSRHVIWWTSTSIFRVGE
jgi:hypothetical protein